VNQLFRDQALQHATQQWAQREGVTVVSCAGPDTAFRRQYAADLGLEIRPDPLAAMPGRAGWVVVVRPRTAT
jgi:hypothetical protein